MAPRGRARKMLRPSLGFSKKTGYAVDGRHPAPFGNC